MTGDWRGRLLVARPRLHGPEFERTVILLLDHDEQGAFGVVLNRPLDVAVDVVLPGWQRWVSAPATLFRGGPVGTDTALGLVRVDDEATAPADPASAVRLLELDAEPSQVARTRGTRVFVGYAGWSAGQLEAEVDAGAWWVLDALPGDAFTAQPEALWSQVMRRQGGELALLHLHPGDPRLN